MLMTQISKDNKTHYASLSENYVVADDIVLFKNKTEHWAACSRVGIINPRQHRGRD